GTINLGAGTLTLNASVTTVTINGTNSATASIIGTTGSLDLAVASPITFDVSSTGQASDLDIQVPITGTGGFTKSGSGTMELDAAGTYSGTTTIDAGTLDVTASGALGTSTVAVDGTGSLALDGTGGAVTLSNSLTLASSANGLASPSGSNTLSGAITLQANAFVDVEDGSTLTISGAIGDGGDGFGVTKIAGGTMVYAAAQANTYTGTTTVGLGELDFDSTAANGAIAGPLKIGTGPVGSAAVKYLASNQVPSSTNMTVFDSQAELDLNGYSDSTNDLRVTGGLVSLPVGSSLTAAELTMICGDVNTGTGSTFTLAGDVTINDSPSGS